MWFQETCLDYSYHIVRFMEEGGEALDNWWKNITSQPDEMDRWKDQEYDFSGDIGG